MGVFERGFGQEQKLSGPGTGRAASAMARGMLRSSCRMCSSRFQAPGQGQAQGASRHSVSAYGPDTLGRGAGDRGPQPGGVNDLRWGHSANSGIATTASHPRCPGLPAQRPQTVQPPLAIQGLSLQCQLPGRPAVGHAGRLPLAREIWNVREGKGCEV